MSWLARGDQGSNKVPMRSLILRERSLRGSVRNAVASKEPAEARAGPLLCVQHREATTNGQELSTDLGREFDEG